MIPASHFLILNDNYLLFICIYEVQKDNDVPSPEYWKAPGPTPWHRPKQLLLPRKNMKPLKINATNRPDGECMYAAIVELNWYDVSPSAAQHCYQS